MPNWRPTTRCWPSWRAATRLAGAKRSPSRRSHRKVGPHDLPASEGQVLGTPGLSLEGGHNPHPCGPGVDVADLSSLSTPNASSTTPTVLARNRIELSVI